MFHTFAHHCGTPTLTDGELRSAERWATHHGNRRWSLEVTFSASSEVGPRQHTCKQRLEVARCMVAMGLCRACMLQTGVADRAGTRKDAVIAKPP